MSAVNATIQALLANSGVTAQVAQRINPGTAPQSGALPDIVVSRVSETPTYGLARASDLTEARIQVECRARTSTAVEKVGQAVIAALKDGRGTFASKACVFRAAGSDYDDHADDASVFRRIIDFYAWVSEPA